jgi:hypothetical protein
MNRIQGLESWTGLFTVESFARLAYAAARAFLVPVDLGAKDTY